MKFTVGKLAKRFGLSRSTLLYYDRIGVLSPSSRGANRYRHYSEADAVRLEKILMFREMGLPLEAIGPLLSAKGNSVADALKQRLGEINSEISALRKQQEVILRLLQDGSASRRSRTMDKAGWVALLEASGMTDEDMWNWHREFERLAPEAHQDFLESLGIGAEEIARIRRRSSRSAA